MLIIFIIPINTGKVANLIAASNNILCRFIINFITSIFCNKTNTHIPQPNTEPFIITDPQIIISEILTNPRLRLPPSKGADRSLVYTLEIKCRSALLHSKIYRSLSHQVDDYYRLLTTKVKIGITSFFSFDFFEGPGIYFMLLSIF